MSAFYFYEKGFGGVQNLKHLLIIKIISKFIKSNAIYLMKIWN